MSTATASWTDAQKAEIVKRLSEKHLGARCPMCGESGFILLEGFFMNPVQESLTGDLVIGGPAIPTIAIACRNCGYISQHAAGVLGLLPGEASK